MGEILSQSFVVRLAEMQDIISNQKNIIRNLSDVIQQTSLKVIVDEQRDVIENLTKILHDQRKTFDEKELFSEHKCRSTINTGKKLVCGNKLFKIVIVHHTDDMLVSYLSVKQCVQQKIILLSII